MCMSCGCGEPNERHGNDANITQDDLERAAQGADITMDHVAENITSAVQAA